VLDTQDLPHASDVMTVDAAGRKGVLNGTAFTVPMFDAFMRRVMPGDDWRNA